MGKVLFYFTKYLYFLIRGCKIQSQNLYAFIMKFKVFHGHQKTKTIF